MILSIAGNGIGTIMMTKGPAPEATSTGLSYKLYMDTAFPVLIIFGFCCGGIALILSVIALATAKQPEAKSRATTVAIIAGVMIVIAILGNLLSVFLKK